MHSREYFRQIMKIAADRDLPRLRKATAHLRGKTVEVIVEAARDERFYLEGGSDGTAAIRARAGKDIDIFLRVPPGSIGSVLEGIETPVEAFFLGHLRARGHTRDLYGFHAFFLALAEIAVVSPEIQDLVESFRRTKGTS
jgi:hypothetical protein